MMARRALAFSAALALALICTVTARSSHAATITVGGTCTLTEAINAANANSVNAACTAAAVGGAFGDDTIELTSDVTISTAATPGAINVEGVGLPNVTSRITINGHGHTIQRATLHPGAAVTGIDHDRI